MISKITEEEIKELLSRNLDIQELVVSDLKGGDHWQIDISARDFNGLNTMKKHRVIYKILAEPLASGAIHALVINVQESLI